MLTGMSVTLNNSTIEAIVTSRKSDVDRHIRNFLSNRRNEKKVIGLDVELTMIEDAEETEDSEMNSGLAILQLCDGDTCLIIQLPFLESVPNSLLNFLQLPDFAFVGIGIKETLAKLETEYGLGCKNAVELGPLAASVMQRPHLAACGLDLLGRMVDSLRLDKPTSVVFSDWGKMHLKKKQIKSAAANAFAYFKIGNRLLDG